jgi:hypothetical protein
MCVNVQLLQIQLLNRRVGLNACGQGSADGILQVYGVQLQAQLIMLPGCLLQGPWLLGLTT